MSWPTLSPGERLPVAVDPYAAWAAATQGAYLASHTQSRCRLALHLREKENFESLLKIKGLRIPGVYAYPVRFCSAEVSAWEAVDWQRLHELADVVLAEPGMARPDDEARALDSMRPRRRPTPPGQSGPPASNKRRVVIGVIDGACGFAHRQFRRLGNDGKWQTRLTAFWDQQRAADASMAAWRRPPELGYGCELLVEEFNTLLGQHLDHLSPADDEAQAFAERAIYRTLGVSLPAAADWSHGTHVLDTAGGWPVAVSAPGGDPAPSANVEEAELIVVQLPEVALRDTSGRWMPALVLDGLRYIVARAGPTAEIVVNLSLGAFAGPHDGSSMLERAVDELIDELNGRLTVVVAAGNAASPRNDGDGTRRHCHAETLLERNKSATLFIDIDERDATETFVELWLPTRDGEARAPAAVTVELVPPDGQATVRASSGHAATWQRQGGGMALAQVVNLSGSSGSGPRGGPPMVMVAIGTTRNVAGWRAPLGRWQIRVQLEGDVSQDVVLQAWVERRDVPGELPGERPQYGFAAELVARTPEGAPRWVSVGPGVNLPDTNTLGSLANGAKTIVVAGAEYPAEEPKPPHISPVSSLGPAPHSGNASHRKPGGTGPLLAAPCELTAAGFLTGSHKTLKGTSMSSAWVTRLIASELIANGRPAQGVRCWLLSLAHRPAQDEDVRGRLPSLAPTASQESGPEPRRAIIPILRRQSRQEAPLPAPS